MKSCHKLSKPARRAMAELDDVEQGLVAHAMERRTRYVLPNRRHRLTEIRLGERVVVITWRYEGEVVGTQRRRIVHWDHAFISSVPPDNQHAFGASLLHHLIATALVALAAAGAKLLYEYWPQIQEVVLRIH